MKYSCPDCDLKDAAVDVDARRGGEDVVTWTDRMVAELCAHHATLRPSCHPKTLSEIRIPIAAVDRIGDPPGSSN